MFNFHQSRDGKEALLVDAVRAEIRAGVEPLAREVASVKEAVERVERAQQAMYTKEVVDLKLKERDDALAALREDHAALSASLKSISATVGGMWKQAFVTAGIVLGPISTLIVLWPKLAALFQ